MSSSLQEPRVPSPEKTRGTVDDDDMADVRPDWSLQGFGELMVHVALFMLSGPTLILLQKYVLGILNFEYPIFIVTLAALARWLLILTLVHTGVLKLGKHGDMTFLQWTRGMLPVGILECISLAFHQGFDGLLDR